MARPALRRGADLHGMFPKRSLAAPLAITRKQRRGGKTNDGRRRDDKKHGYNRRPGVHSVKQGRHAAQIIRLWAWSPSSLPSGASAALSAARSPPRALSSRSSLCTYSWLGLGLGCPGRLLEPLHTQCTLQRKMRNRRALWSAIASTTQRAPANRGARTARGACGWTARPTPRCATP